MRIVPPEMMHCLMNSIAEGKCLAMFSKGMSKIFITLYLNSYTNMVRIIDFSYSWEERMKA
jgi:hypothetical protein